MPAPARSSNHHLLHHRLDLPQHPPQRFVTELETLLASGVSTDEAEEAAQTHTGISTPLSLGLRQQHRSGGDDDNETSALQAILNASGDDSSSPASSSLMEVSPRETSDPVEDEDGDDGDPRLPPSPPTLLSIPGLGHNSNGTADHSMDR